MNSAPTLETAKETPEELMAKIAKDLRENMKDLPPEFQRAIQEKFWELLE